MVGVGRARRIIRRTTWRLSLLYLIGLLLLYVVEATVAERWWPTLLLTYVVQYPLLLPAAALLLVSLLVWESRAVMVNLLALLLLAFAFLGVAPPHWPSAAPAGARLRVMTLNAAYLKQLTPGDLAGLAAEHHLDLICLQEASGLRYRDTAGEFLRELPGWRLVAEGQLPVLTRLPVRGWQVHPYTKGRRVAVAVQVEVEKQVVTVVNTHFSSVYPPNRFRQDWRKLAAYVQEMAAVRETEAEELLALVQARQAKSEPVLVMGDFNTPPRGLLYRRLTAPLRDSFAATGTGTGYTFPSVSPRYRIDYLFAGRGVTPRRCQRLPVQVSDHCPVVGELVIRKERR